MVLLLLAAAAAGAPEGELLREESFNYRVVGKLPPGWKQRSGALVFAYSVDDIPHAYVHLVRQRVDVAVDVEKAVRKRDAQYRLPGAPKEAKPVVSRTTWGGRPAVRYEFEAKVQGVLCRRRVTALFATPYWYELIETIHGAKTHEDAGCEAGLRVFRRGFRILTPALDPKRSEDTAEQTIANDELGYSIRKPKGFVRVNVDPGADPGCRVAFEARAGKASKHIRVRLFEYGATRAFDATRWMDIFYTSFAGIHVNSQREPGGDRKIKGAHLVTAEYFTGRRENRDVRTLVLLMSTRKGRIYALRVRTQDGAEAEFSTAIADVISSVSVSD